MLDRASPVTEHRPAPDRGPAARPDRRTPALVMAAACAIAVVGFGARSTFGLFLEPMTAARGWGRETFALALAIQNLVWGASLPVAGALSDRFGPSRVLAAGAVVYALGVRGMAHTESPALLQMTAGVLVGVGVAFTAFTIALAAMAKVVGPERRSLALGLGTAAGSFGQVVFSPIGQGFIDAFGWQTALAGLSASVLVIAPLAWLLPGASPGPGAAEPDAAAPGPSLRAAVREAMGHPRVRPAHRGLLRLRVPRGVHHRPLPRLRPRPRPARLGRGRGDRGHRPVQRPRLARGRRRRPALEPEMRAQHHLRPAGGRDHRADAGPQDHHRHLPVLRRHGRAVAVDGAADHRHRGPHLRTALPRDAVRLRLPEPPARQLPRRLARRPAPTTPPGRTTASGGRAWSSASPPP